MQNILQYIVPLIPSVLAVVASYVAYYFSVRASVRARIVRDIALVEETDLGNEEKFNAIVEDAIKNIPLIVKPLFSSKVIQTLVQTTFDSVKLYAINRELNNK